MKKTSEAQTRATEAYRKRNPEKTYYKSVKSPANLFARMSTPKAIEAIAAVGVDRYREDLLALRDAIDEKLKTL